MIDYIKITLQTELTENNFINCSKAIPTKYGFYRFLKNEKKNHSLIVVQGKNSTKVTIRGSLRKWYFGKYSLLDFTKESFRKAINTLAKSLNVDLDDLGQGKITQCEIGLNVRTRISCKKIIPNIVEYGRLINPNNYRNLDETTYQKGYDKKFIAYDKCKEILNGCHSFKKRIRKKKAFETLADKGYHFLRIEIRLFDKKSFANHKLGHITCLSDLYNNWCDLYGFFTSQISKLTIYRPIAISEKMSKKELQLAEFLNGEDFASDYNAKITELLSQCKSQTAKGLSSAKTRMHNKIKRMIFQYGRKEEYSSIQLRVDVALHLIHICKYKEDNLALPYLIRNLWGAN